jgi:hypothetical protein
VIVMTVIVMTVIVMTVIVMTVIVMTVIVMTVSMAMTVTVVVFMIRRLTADPHVTTACRTSAFFAHKFLGGARGSCRAFALATYPRRSPDPTANPAFHPRRRPAAPPLTITEQRLATEVEVQGRLQAIISADR